MTDRLYFKICPEMLLLKQWGMTWTQVLCAWVSKMDLKDDMVMSEFEINNNDTISFRRREVTKEFLDHNTEMIVDEVKENGKAPTGSDS